MSINPYIELVIAVYGYESVNHNDNNCREGALISVAAQDRAS